MLMYTIRQGCRQIYVVANPQLAFWVGAARARCRQIYVVANPQLIAPHVAMQAPLSANLRCRQSATAELLQEVLRLLSANLRCRQSATTYVITFVLSTLSANLRCRQSATLKNAQSQRAKLSANLRCRQSATPGNAGVPKGRCRQIYVVANPQLTQEGQFLGQAVGKSTLSPIRNNDCSTNRNTHAVGKSTLSPIRNLCNH